MVILKLAQDQWQSWRSIIRDLPLWLLPITAVIAFQFNRSRLAYLSFLFLIYYAVERSFISDSQLLQQYAQPVFITGCLILTYLSLIKDRILFSIFGLINLVAIIICLFVSALLVHLINNNTDQLINTLPWVITPEDLVFIPWFICLSAIMIRSIQDVTLTTTATAISFLLWSIEYFQPMLFPSAMLFIIVSTIYLLSILFDSYALAYRDELTGLPSRRALYNLVLSLGPKYTVAMSDIDHFKKFNDTYGHDVGDQVLKLVSSKLSKISGGGKVFRYGGEEFTIVFPRKSAEETLNHLETVRQTIEDYQIILRDEKRKKGDKKSRSQASNTNKTVSVTISIGAANKVRGENFEHALKQADIALYKAKKQGRNQVCI